MHTESHRRGGALLIVMWLAAALSLIAFSLAVTVRGETERTSTVLDGVRAYYLASGAVDRAILYMLWGSQEVLPDGTPRYYAAWMNRLHFSFPSGDATVEIIPETAKLGLNSAPPDDLYRLLAALGASPEQATVVSMGIEDWRRPSPDGTPSAFDRYYLSLTPSFLARHASFEEVEELLLVRGVTRDLFFGGSIADSSGRLIRTPGLRECVSVYGSPGPVDVNSAPPPVLQAVGLNPGTVASIVTLRQQAPFRLPEQLDAFSSDPAAARLSIGAGRIFTLRATAQLKLPGGSLSDLRRSVAALVSFVPGMGGRPYRVLRWYDNVWVQ
ncbi:MAG: hypothetical protein ABFD60_11855 [Bryobacteraceae bacterium]